MEDSIAAQLVAALNILALEQISEEGFKLVAAVPSWLRHFDAQPAIAGKIFQPGELFPFLDAFIFDAESHWESEDEDWLRSGPWTESDLAGNEYALEASARLINGRRIMIVEHLGNEYEEKKELLQQLREQKLTDSSMIKKIRAEVIAGTKADELAGEILNDRYELLKVIGQGGLGVVYKGIDRETKKDVAVKLLIDDDEGDEESDFSRKLFEREIKILKRVTHPNIVAILDAGLTNTGRQFLVMDYVSGLSLDALLEVEKIWEVDRVLNLLRQICPALHAMHQEEIIHRDLKPANIMIQTTPTGERAILLDLGIAKMVRGTTEKSLMAKVTRTGVILGTVQYLSPEQCRDKELDGRADIYALSILVYEMLSGDLPFYADSITGWLLAHIQQEPDRLRKINPMISSAVEEVVHWGMAKKREDRPATMLDFLDRFEKAVASSY